MSCIHSYECQQPPPPHHVTIAFYRSNQAQPVTTKNISPKVPPHFAGKDNDHLIYMHMYVHSRVNQQYNNYYTLDTNIHVYEV